MSKILVALLYLTGLVSISECVTCGRLTRNKAGQDLQVDAPGFNLIDAYKLTVSKRCLVTVWTGWDSAKKTYEEGDHSTYVYYFKCSCYDTQEPPNCGRLIRNKVEQKLRKYAPGFNLIGADRLIVSKGCLVTVWTGWDRLKKKTYAQGDYTDVHVYYFKCKYIGYDVQEPLSRCIGLNWDCNNDTEPCCNFNGDDHDEDTLFTCQNRKCRPVKQKVRVKFPDNSQATKWAFDTTAKSDKKYFPMSPLLGQPPKCYTMAQQCNYFFTRPCCQYAGIRHMGCRGRSCRSNYRCAMLYSRPRHAGTPRNVDDRVDDGPRFIDWRPVRSVKVIPGCRLELSNNEMKLSIRNSLFSLGSFYTNRAYCRCGFTEADMTVTL